MESTTTAAADISLQTMGEVTPTEPEVAAVLNALSLPSSAAHRRWYHASRRHCAIIAAIAVVCFTAVIVFASVSLRGSGNDASMSASKGIEEQMGMGSGMRSADDSPMAMSARLGRARTVSSSGATKKKIKSKSRHGHKTNQLVSSGTSYGGMESDSMGGPAMGRSYAGERASRTAVGAGRASIRAEAAPAAALEASFAGAEAAPVAVEDANAPAVGSGSAPAEMGGAFGSAAVAEAAPAGASAGSGAAPAAVGGASAGSAADDGSSLAAALRGGGVDNLAKSKQDMRDLFAAWQQERIRASARGTRDVKSRITFLRR